MATFTPNADEKLRALRRMKLIATGAFLLMTAVFILTERLGTGNIIWLIRWDHVNAFAEASMVGALADWFAVVALFRHPLGIPIWHTAIIPRKKDEIGRNLGTFVETRLLSIENLTREIGRFSVSRSITAYLATEEHRRKAASWLLDGLGAIVRTLDDEQVEQLIGNAATDKLKSLNASSLLGRGLDAVIASGQHERLIDQILRQVAAWVPSHRDTVEEFIEHSVERTLKWGSRLVPGAMIDRATDQTLTALIDVLTAAANNPEHPLRTDLNARVLEWADRLKNDPEWMARVNSLKDEAVDHPRVRAAIAEFWAQTKERLLQEVDNPDSSLGRYAYNAVGAFQVRLENDAAMQETIDARLRETAIMLLSNNHHAIGSLIQRVVDVWDAEQLSRELELNLGRDLQYIRLNGTIIGGVVGLLIHLLR